MTLAIASVVVTVLLVAGAGIVLWLLAPTVRTFAGPDFVPTPKDEESVFNALQSATCAGGGGVGV
jgi:hypothetical protein